MPGTDHQMYRRLVTAMSASPRCVSRSCFDFNDTCLRPRFFLLPRATTILIFCLRAERRARRGTCRRDGDAVFYRRTKPIVVEASLSSSALFQAHTPYEPLFLQEVERDYEAPLSMDCGGRCEAQDIALTLRAGSAPGDTVLRRFLCCLRYATTTDARRCLMLNTIRKVQAEVAKRMSLPPETCHFVTARWQNETRRA